MQFYNKVLLTVSGIAMMSCMPLNKLTTRGQGTVVKQDLYYYIDTDNDGKIDTGTISTAFLGYAPYNNPTVSFTVITPDVSIVNNNDYISMITKRTVQDISNAYFRIVS